MSKHSTLVGVAAHPAREEVGVVVQVPVVEGETRLLVQPLPGRLSPPGEPAPESWLRGGPRRLNDVRGRQIGTLGHPVVDQFQETAPLASREPVRSPQKVSP